MRALVQVDATDASLKGSVSTVAGTGEGSMVVGAGSLRPTMGESGGGKARIRAFVDVDALAELLAGMHDALVARLALAVPLAAPLAMPAWIVLVAVSSAACVLAMIPIVSVAL